MSYEMFEKLCRAKGVKPYDVSKATGISSATLSSWKSGSYTPKEDKRKAIADYFNVSLEYLDSGREEALLIGREKFLIEMFRKLNVEGQYKILDYLGVLVVSKMFEEEKDD